MSYLKLLEYNHSNDAKYFIMFIFYVISVVCYIYKYFCKFYKSNNTIRERYIDFIVVILFLFIICYFITNGSISQIMYYSIFFIAVIILIIDIIYFWFHPGIGIAYEGIKIKRLFSPWETVHWHRIRISKHRGKNYHYRDSKKKREFAKIVIKDSPFLYRYLYILDDIENYPQVIETIENNPSTEKISKDKKD